MSKYLIIHADDFGMCHSINRAIMDAFEFNTITSASIMAPCNWFPEVVRWAKQHTEFDLGVHLTFTSEWDMYRWRPIYNASSLVDKDKYCFKNVKDFQIKADIREVEIEIQGQIEKITSAGIKPSHVDSHMFVANARVDILNMVAKQASAYGLQFNVEQKIVMSDLYVPYLQWWTHYDKLLSEVTEGITKLIVHPGYDDEELGSITEGYVAGNSRSRLRDMTVISSNEFKNMIDKYNIKLISYKDIKELQCV